ncbi:hypothetical protein AVEN_101576-1 [Araneus ventricosus]|uniref:Uncharacterized protein n=1 Tax=Araneus ventricosus TaxID=182803 RepID=A0A4Y2WK76_ARAVE|nr:hypothetical protein AVEN_101576-1 [Araneus ventricosus]
MLLTYVDTLFLYFLAVKVNGYEWKWALERVLSKTSSILLVLSINGKREEFTAALRRANFMNNPKSKQIMNVSAGLILASPFIYALVLLLACEIGKDELGFHYFYYGIPVGNKFATAMACLLEIYAKNWKYVHLRSSQPQFRSDVSNSEEKSTKCLTNCKHVSLFCLSLHVQEVFPAASLCYPR